MQNAYFAPLRPTTYLKQTLKVLTLMLCFIDLANAQNPYQEALKQQRMIEQQQRQPVGPLGIPPSQIELQRNLEQELYLQEQKIQTLQGEINRLKRKRAREQEENE